MTDIPNEVNIHSHNHKHTHVEQMGKLHSTNLVIFLENIDFQRRKCGFLFSEKNITSPMFCPEYIQ